jgi:hypothetical protein
MLGPWASPEPDRCFCARDGRCAAALAIPALAGRYLDQFLEGLQSPINRVLGLFTSQPRSPFPQHLCGELVKRGTSLFRLSSPVSNVSGPFQRPPHHPSLLAAVNA